MTNFFSDLFKTVVNSVQSQQVFIDQSVFKYAGEGSKLFAFNHLYADGVEVLLIRGKLNKAIQVNKKQVENDEQLICSLVVNFQSLTYYYENGMESQVSDRDVFILHNKHAGFNIVFEENKDLFILALRLHGQAYKENKSLIFKHIAHVYNEQEQVLFVKTFISPETIRIIGDIEKQLNMPASFFEPYIKAKVHEMFLLNLYEMTVADSKLLSYAISPDKLSLANKVRQLIQDDLTRHLTVKEISQNVGASETLVKDVFQRVYGVPIYTFYQNIRLAQAMQLFHQQHAIVEVAYSLGFSTPSNFTKFFKAKLGITPREYITKKNK